ncbi:MAG: hypothetical protein ABI706_07650 [Ilumatobacteraceae bacterium]
MDDRRVESFAELVGGGHGDVGEACVGELLLVVVEGEGRVEVVVDDDVTDPDPPAVARGSESMVMRRPLCQSSSSP